MKKRGIVWLMSAMVALALIALALRDLGHSQAASPDSIGLQGTVSSKAEGKMEGVLVSGKREGSPITVTVVSDSQGRYAFPADRLRPGTYHLTTRAGGYRPADARVEAISQKTAQKDIVLDKVTDNLELAKQLTFSEWVLSVPKAEPVFCVACHTLAPIMSKTLDVRGWEERLLRDRNYVGGSPNITYTSFTGRAARTELGRTDKELAKLLGEIAGESKLRAYELKLFPRPKGRATKVIITQYDLPLQHNERPEPHSFDVKNGWVWAGNLIGDPMLLDTRTGEVTTFPVPEFRKGHPIGSADVEMDQEGNGWIILRHQAGIGQVTRKGEWKFYSIPEKDLSERDVTAHLGLQALATQNMVWFKENNFNAFFKLDVKTGKVASLHPFGTSASIMDRHEQTMIARGSLPPRPGRGHRFYDMVVDKEGNGWSTDIEGSVIMKIDRDTEKITLYPTPTPDAGPRRGEWDERGRLWFSEYHASQLGMFDPATGQFQEWKIPKPAEHTYSVYPARNGEIWSAGQWNDWMYRFNPKTGEWTQYLLPSIGTDIHKVVEDNSTKPVSMWISETRQGKLTKLEALE